MANKRGKKEKGKSLNLVDNTSANGGGGGGKKEEIDRPREEKNEKKRDLDLFVLFSLVLYVELREGVASWPLWGDRGGGEAT